MKPSSQLYFIGELGAPQLPSHAPPGAQHERFPFEFNTHLAHSAVFAVVRFEIPRFVRGVDVVVGVDVDATKYGLSAGEQTTRPSSHV